MVTVSDDMQSRNSLQEFINIFLHPDGIARESPEWKLLMGVLWDFLGLNAVWLLIVVSLYTLWIRRIFAPIDMINTHIRDFLGTPQFRSLIYRKNDEFRPLIRTLNNLHDSLAEQEAIRTQFLADLSHELRTPMTAIQCLLEAIDDGILSLDANTITQLQSEMTRLVRITNQIMTADLLLQPSEHTEENIPIAHITESIVQQYLPQLQKNQQKILSSFSESLTLHISSDHYIQILHNIFSNFIKYAGKNTTLRLTHKRNPHFSELVFTDDGVGVKRENLRYIGEKFFREDPGRTQHDMHSMGIGISLIRRILEHHGGSLTKKSTKPHGLTLILSIPHHHE